MFIILVSEDTITNNLESIDIQNLPFEINDDDLITSVLTPSSLIMYKSNTTVDGMCQIVFKIYFLKTSTSLNIDY